MRLLKKIIFHLTTLSILPLITFTAGADTFRMKDGTEINGSVISETYNSYLLRAEATKNVYVEKRILKSDVAKITKTDKSIAAFEEITSIVPTRDMMKTTDYELIVKSTLEPFLKKYPASPHFKAAKMILSTLKKEYFIIKSGGIKINGKLFTHEQIEADKYDIQASVSQHNFMTYAQKKQYRAALSTLERMEDDYPDTKECRAAQKVALVILPRYERKLLKLSENVELLTEKRNRALDSMNPGDRSRTKKIFEYEDKQYQRLLDLASANKKKTKWLPINKYFIEPIEKNLKMIEIEMKRINIASQKPTMDIGELYRNTYNALESGDYQMAKESLDNFKRSKPPEELVNELEQRLQEAKSVMEELAIQKKEDEKIARKKATEELARLAKEKKDAQNNKVIKKDDDRSLKDTALEKMNINKKKAPIDKLSQ